MVLFITAIMLLCSQLLFADMNDEIIKCASWLESMMVPNNIIEKPNRRMENLIIGYDVPETDSSHFYLSGKSFTYDNALAAIALVMAGNYTAAGKILDAMAGIIDKDGSYWFSHDTRSAWPLRRDKAGAVKRSGAAAWAGYAFVYYIMSAETGDSFQIEESRRQKYIDKARAVAGYLQGLQVKEKSDPRYGLVTGGWGTNILRLSPESGEIEEVFSDDEVNWASTEHNIDCYFFFRDLAMVTGNNLYHETAETIQKNLIGKLWDEGKGQLLQGMSREGEIDDALPLDCASWGAIFLAASGEREKAAVSLRSAEKYFSINAGNFEGYSMYGDEPVYESRELSEKYGSPVWKDTGIVWHEGTLGVAAAYALTGDTDRAEKITARYGRHFSDGIIPYASDEVPHILTPWPAVASTAWYIIAIRTASMESGLFWKTE